MADDLPNDLDPRCYCWRSAKTRHLSARGIHVACEPRPEFSLFNYHSLVLLTAQEGTMQMNLLNKRKYQHQLTPIHNDALGFCKI